MSDAALGIWASLVRLAGTGKKTVEVDQENFQLPAVPGEEGVGTSRCPPVRPLLSPKQGGLLLLLSFFCHYIFFLIQISKTSVEAWLKRVAAGRGGGRQFYFKPKKIDIWKKNPEKIDIIY